MMLNTFESYLTRLNDLLQSSCEREEIKQLSRFPFLEDHELAHATYALVKQQAHLPLPTLRLNPLKSGAVPIFRRGFFPWGAFPYPKEHAQLGSILTQLDSPVYQEIARNMLSFQQATFDHTKRPLYAFFSQERGFRYCELEEANRTFLESLSSTVSDTFSFVDEDLGIVSQRFSDQTRVFFGSGCKSAMGIFLAGDAGVVNFGPQLLPLDNGKGFGLAGRAKDFQYEKINDGCGLRFQSRLASFHNRKTGFRGIDDSGYSALWVDTQIRSTLDSIELTCCFEGFRPLSSIVFSFFGKGESCYVAKHHKLNPRSLDRYQGPPQPIVLKGEKSAILIEAQEGLSQMEVIPLAGDDSFWNADFLIAYSFNTPHLKFTLKGPL